MPGDQEGPRTFDVSALVQSEAARNSSRRWAQAAAGMVFGLGIAAVGVYVGFVHFTGPTLTAYAEGTALVVTGIGLAIAAWYFSVRTYRRVPNLLAVSAESLTYGLREDQSSMTHLSWNSPRLKLVLHDRSTLHATLGERDRFAVYSLVVEGGPRVPLTKPAFDAILSEAAKRGLTKSRQEIGTVAIVVLKHPK